MRAAIRLSRILLAGLVLAGCGAHYVTPGGAAPFLGGADTDTELEGLGGHFDARPAASFPAGIAVVRLQDAGYYPDRYRTPGARYVVVPTRDIEAADTFERLASLDGVRAVAPLSRLLLPEHASRIDDMRGPAARMQADLLLLYTVDTALHVEGRPLGPLSTISLGLLRNKRAEVTATVAAILVDVRTGFVYGMSEESRTVEKKASMWSTAMVVEAARLEAEKQAFAAFVDEFPVFWSGVVRTHATADRVPRGVRYSTSPGSGHFATIERQ